MAPALADGASLVMPRELTYFDSDSGQTYREHHRAKADWFRAHGVDPADWQQISPILSASKRAHARTPKELAELDRRLVIADAEERAQ